MTPIPPAARSRRIASPLSTSQMTTPLPYQDASIGDIIIRTSDNVEFHVHSRRLADASPFFADMFTLPPLPTTSSTEGPTITEKLAVDVSEASTVWSKILPLIYLAEEPPLDLADLRALIATGRKYGIPGVVGHARGPLYSPEFLDEHPYAVYALACFGGFEDVARVAARRTLKMSGCPRPAEAFEFVGGDAVCRLMRYREECCEAAVLITEVMNQADILLPCNPTSRGFSCSVPTQPIYFENDGWKSTYKSCIEYLDGLSKGLSHRPDPSLARHASLLTIIVTSVLSCATCRSTIYERCNTFAEQTEARIETAISQVSVQTVESGEYI
ncbi:uncharacterized protein BXZ73DRAFT_54503 [Epithele typhae]|uniref:uncharacterized protein n=1 Tax=Epithele typhae TaxID=378194 RepID=UPI002008344D|nr:uncharacterized protein BXZ73DRAFT_54503 [Epithele typhae]KAH9915191.1 hypothetical protein BXZ73DRAFT_54503 [Epithele typhae]